MALNGNSMGYKYKEVESAETFLRNALIKSGKLESYEYVVFIARRSFNLEYIWENEWKTTISQKHTITTDTGLLGYVEEIITDYEHGKGFPSLIYIDDIMITGEAIYHSVAMFFSALIRKLKRWHSVTEIEKIIYSEVMPKVDFVVYMRDKDKDQLCNELQWKVMSLTSRDITARHAITKAFVDELNGSINTNTVFNLSAYVDEEAETGSKNGHILEVKNGWRKEEFDTKDENEEKEGRDSNKSAKWTLFYKKLAPNYIMTVRYYCKVKEKKKRWYFTPFLFHEAMPEQKYRMIVENLSLALKKKTENSNELAAILDSAFKEDSLPDSYYEQMVEMLFGQMILKSFLSECSLDNVSQTAGSEGEKNSRTLQYDYSKIKRNFGKLVSESAWTGLCGTNWKEEELANVIGIRTPELFVKEEQSGSEISIPEEKLSNEKRCYFESYKCAITNRLERKMEKDNLSLKSIFDKAERVGMDLMDVVENCMKEIGSGGLGRALGAILSLYDRCYISIWPGKVTVGSSEASLRGLCFSHTEMSLAIVPKLIMGDADGEKLWEGIKKCASVCDRLRLPITRILEMYLDENLQRSTEREKYREVVKYIGKTLEEHGELFLPIWDW